MLLGPIYFKEFVKIRWWWLTLALLNGLLMTYVAIETRRLFVLDHSEVVWYRVMHLNEIHYLLLKYAPLLTGLLLAFIQYLPEMVGQRLRLSLHLPVSPHRLILAHLLVGVTALGAILLFALAALALVTVRFFPVEAVVTALLTAFPWCLAGLAGYLGVTLAMLEPNYRVKLFNLAVAAGVAGLFLQPALPGGYKMVLSQLAILLLLLVPAVLLPAYRFRYRRVSR